MGIAEIDIMSPSRMKMLSRYAQKLQAFNSSSSRAVSTLPSTTTYLKKDAVPAKMEDLTVMKSVANERKVELAKVLKEGTDVQIIRSEPVEILELENIVKPSSLQKMTDISTDLVSHVIRIGGAEIVSV